MAPNHHACDLSQSVTGALFPPVPPPRRRHPAVRGRCDGASNPLLVAFEQ